MRLYEDYNLAIYHINKTGGTSVNAFVRNLLGVIPPNINKYYLHEPLKYKIERLGKEFDKLTVLTTIRNPYARFVSLYTFRHGKFKPAFGEYEEEPLNFKEWLIKKPEFSISECLSVLPDNLTILRLEDLESELRPFLSRVLDMEVLGEIPHLKETDHGPYEDYYDDDLRQIVYEREKWVIDKYYGDSI